MDPRRSHRGKEPSVPRQHEAATGAMGLPHGTERGADGSHRGPRTTCDRWPRRQRKHGSCVPGVLVRSVKVRQLSQVTMVGACCGIWMSSTVTCARSSPREATSRNSSFASASPQPRARKLDPERLWWSVWSPPDGARRRVGFERRDELVAGRPGFEISEPYECAAGRRICKLRVPEVQRRRSQMRCSACPDDASAGPISVPHHDGPDGDADSHRLGTTASRARRLGPAEARDATLGGRTASPNIWQVMGLVFGLGHQMDAWSSARRGESAASVEVGVKPRLRRHLA